MLLAAVCFSAFAWPQLAAVAIKWPLQLALVLLSTSVFVTLVRYRVQKESFFFFVALHAFFSSHSVSFQHLVYFANFF